MAALVVLFLGRGPPALSAAVRAAPGAAAGPCSAAAAGGRMDGLRNQGKIKKELRGRQQRSHYCPSSVCLPRRN